jgi:hypothetical protein
MNEYENEGATASDYVRNRRILVIDDSLGAVQSVAPRRFFMYPKRVGFLIYPGMQALDLAGPMDAFAAVSLADDKVASGQVTSSSRLDLSPAPFRLKTDYCSRRSSPRSRRRSWIPW